MVKISSLELENIKRIKAVSLTPAENGLTVIGGENGQGKTSVLDAISWALGGDKFRPSAPKRDGSVIPPHLRVTLSNGLIVERSGDKGTLKVTDPNGGKGGQQLLNEFVEQLALNLPKFMQSTSKEKAQILLRIIGVGDELTRLELQEQQTYNQRRAIGQFADRKAKYAEELPAYHDVPAEEISISDLIQSQQEILARNGENQRKRSNLANLEREYSIAVAELERLQKRTEQLSAELETARKSAEDLQDQSTEEIENNIKNIDAINAKIRANIERERALQEAKDIKAQYNDLSDEIERIRKQKTDLLNGADLPLKGLSVEDGELTYNGAKWDCMSGADQLKTATAIVRRLNPNCGFVLVDKLEQMDEHTLKEFGAWLEAEGLQVIATRVSTGDECSIIIEDGYVKPVVTDDSASMKTWKKGVF